MNTWSLSKKKQRMRSKKIIIWHGWSRLIFIMFRKRLLFWTVDYPRLNKNLTKRLIEYSVSEINRANVKSYSELESELERENTKEHFLVYQNQNQNQKLYQNILTSSHLTHLLITPLFFLKIDDFIHFILFHILILYLII